MKKPAIVILHGWGLSGEKFTPLIEELKKRGYQIFAPDFPGFGKTSIPTKPLHLSDYAGFLHDYLMKHSIRDSVFVCHSFGGRVGLKYEELYPKSVRALILSGTPAFTPVNRKKLFILVLVAKIGGAFWSLPPFCLFKDKVQRYYYYLVGVKEFYRAEGNMRQTFKNIVAEELTSAMKSVDIPSALIWGANDTIVPLPVAKKMIATIPGATLWVIADSDHGVPYKQPEIFADYVEKFLQTL